MSWKAVGLILAFVLLSLSLGLFAWKNQAWRSVYRIPCQAVLLDARVQARNDPPASRDRWQEAIAALEQESDRYGLTEAADSLLESIWRSWPDSGLAPMARILAIRELQLVPGVNATRLSALTLEYIHQALANPKLYFMASHQASSQRIIEIGLRHLGEQGQWVLARQLCFRLRWSAPRLDGIAGPCLQAMAAPSLPRFDIDQELTALPGDTEFLGIDSGNDHGIIRKSIKAYLRNPYDPDRLSELMVKLAASSDTGRVIALRLLPELMQFDHESAWKLENMLY